MCSGVSKDLNEHFGAKVVAIYNRGEALRCHHTEKKIFTDLNKVCGVTENVYFPSSYPYEGSRCC